MTFLVILLVAFSTMFGALGMILESAADDDTTFWIKFLQIVLVILILILSASIIALA